MQSVRHRLDDDAFIFIGKNPVKLRRGKLLVEWSVGQYHLGASFTDAHWLRIQGMNSNCAMLS